MFSRKRLNALQNLAVVAAVGNVQNSSSAYLSRYVYKCMCFGVCVYVRGVDLISHFSERARS